jgi:2'-5' RNA ligase
VARPPDPSRPWRLFIALPVPAASAQRIHEALGPYRASFPDTRWLDPGVYHVTLRFLGAVVPRSVPVVEDAVRRCAWGARPFPIAVGRGGGSRSRSEVAWLELGEGREGVRVLADGLDRLLPPDLLERLPGTRPTPHLTIARRAPGPLVEALADGLRDVPPRWTADRVVLFRSHTGTPTGSRYESLAEARLGVGAAA